MRKLIALLLVALSFNVCYAVGLSETLSKKEIGIEKIVAQNGDPKNETVVSVGKFLFDKENNKITIVEFPHPAKIINFAIRVYDITEIIEEENNIDFVCMSSSQEDQWGGKLWLDDKNRINIEMVNREKPARWVNLSSAGKASIKLWGISRLNLGQ